MQKIISLFQRNYDNPLRLVYNAVTPGAEWVQAGEGTATVKWDGTCCLVKDGQLYKRYEVGTGKRAPANFTPATEVDPVTGKQQGWVPVSTIAPEDQYHRLGFINTAASSDGTEYAISDGTYELVGPKVQGNPYKFLVNSLMRHGSHVLTDVPTTFAALQAWFLTHPIEGIVWHHPDGRMVKIKRKDFGLPWPPKETP